MRTKRPACLPLAPTTWRQILSSSNEEMDDLKEMLDEISETDVAYARVLNALAKDNVKVESLPSETFAGTSLNGQTEVLFPGGQRLRLTASMAAPYARLAARSRLKSTRVQAASIRKGLSDVLGVSTASASSSHPALAVLSPALAESLACGQPTVSADALRAIARHK